ncbi:acyl-CoA dehydrogenase family protein [Xanthobacter sp. KR7-225]|uniref:acyl-CoA dehydrogenase family protein n=1 Tax=Xanthobacter sp. KR7-225 TaxID=3156613 RepID=UPI0032B5016F
MLRPESEAEQAFRAEVRAFLAAAIPGPLRDLTFRPPPEQAMAWYQTLAHKGWIAPHWPKAFGGMGASPVEQVILLEEMARAGAPDIPSQGINHLGPLLMHFGTPAQQARHLPAILGGAVIWCQGYSEPGAGSDLSALRTAARRDGDDLVVNGHKIWTTWGQHAHWMFALVRTSNAGKPREGITFLLIDLASPGIGRRAIRNIAGDDEFCEVFFDEVRVPVENVVGAIDGGWRVATALLDRERIQLGAPAQALRALERVRRLARQLAPPARAALADRIAEAELAVEVLTAAFLDAAERFAAGQDPGAESSYLKILSTETTQAVLDIAQELAGPLMALRDPFRLGDALVDPSEMFLQARRLSIYGGSNEIQRSILADRVLGLKREAR